MKRLNLLLVCLVLAVTTFAAEKTIKLPQPNLDRSGSTMKAFSKRQSTREYATKEINLSDLSDLLWAANGINRPESGKRTAPSAMNRQDVDVYVILPKGSYIYNPQKHELELVAEGDNRPLVAGRQEFVNAAPVCIVLVSDQSRFGDRQGEHSKLMGAMDAGIVSQNISLFCSSADLATVARASMETEKLAKALKLTDSQILMMNHPVGYFKK